LTPTNHQNGYYEEAEINRGKEQNKARPFCILRDAKPGVFYNIVTPTIDTTRSEAGWCEKTAPSFFREFLYTFPFVPQTSYPVGSLSLFLTKYSPFFLDKNQGTTGNNPECYASKKLFASKSPRNGLRSSKLWCTRFIVFVVLQRSENLPLATGVHLPGKSSAYLSRVVLQFLSPHPFCPRRCPKRPHTTPCYFDLGHRCALPFFQPTSNSLARVFFLFLGVIQPHFPPFFFVSHGSFSPSPRSPPFSLPPRITVPIGKERSALGWDWLFSGGFFCYGQSFPSQHTVHP